MPELYDHYQVVKVLGRGAMGIVYLARDLRIGRLVALKTLQEKHQDFETPEEATSFLQRFRREAELCGSLIHPNIITLYEVGYASKRITYLAMEFIDGESLLSLLRRHGKLDLDTALKITDDVLQGLAYAHDRGVIHRDVKPANILVTVDGQAKIADFGVARSVRASLSLRTQEGQILGTPHYMAPEHVAGRGVDSRADLFSVGVVLFEMLSGRKPFGADNIMDTLYNVVNQPTPSLRSFAPEIPPWAESFVEKMLDKAPGGRFVSASAASRELRRLLSGHRSVVDSPMEMTMSVPVLRATTPEETPTTPLQVQVFTHLTGRPVSSLAALGIIALLITGILASIVGITQSIDEHPTVTISEKTLNEFEQKRVMLREAQILYNSGAYDASQRHFDDYLRRYPWSPAASQGRQQASQALEAIRAKSPPLVARIEVLDDRPIRKKPGGQARSNNPELVATTTMAEIDAAPQQPVTIWARVRRFFRGIFVRRPTVEASTSTTAASEQSR